MSENDVDNMSENDVDNERCPDDCVGCYGEGHPCDECGYCALMCHCYLGVAGDPLNTDGAK